MSSILLDTHAWIWLLNGEQLSAETLTLINKEAKTNNIFVSVISVWEIGMLEAKGRIVLEQSPLDWVIAAFEAPGINLMPLTPQIAIESCNLTEFHGDPADRIIVATARVERLTLITRDKKMLAYSKAHKVDAMVA